METWGPFQLNLSISFCCVSPSVCLVFCYMCCELAVKVLRPRFVTTVKFLDRIETLKLLLIHMQGWSSVRICCLNIWVDSYRIHVLQSSYSTFICSSVYFFQKQVILDFAVFQLTEAEMKPTQNPFKRKFLKRSQCGSSSRHPLCFPDFSEVKHLYFHILLSSISICGQHK